MSGEIDYVNHTPNSRSIGPWIQHSYCGSVCMVAIVMPWC